jgi:hypothetical protein
MPREQWKAWRGGPYEVSDQGRVRRGARVLKSSKSGNGYMVFGAHVDGGRSMLLVHRVVAEVFLGPCPRGHEVNHRDGRKTHNALSNLEYVTRSQNMKHATERGLNALPTDRARGDRHWTRLHPERVKRGAENGAALHPERILRGSACPSSKLTERDVAKIRRVARRGNYSALGREYGVSHRTIRSIATGSTWKHV